MTIRFGARRCIAFSPTTSCSSTNGPERPSGVKVGAEVRGAVGMEYALLAALIGAAIVGVLTLVSGEVSRTPDRISQAFQ